MEQARSSKICLSVSTSLAELEALILGFEGGEFEGPPDLSEGEKERLRQLGLTLWRSPIHAQSIMAHAYSALFSVPEFIAEAHQRQPGRFSSPILRHAIQNTASNMWQAFWFDFDREGRPIARDIVPLTGVLRVLHGPQPIPTMPPKRRISDLAMFFFAFNIIRAVEFMAICEGINEPNLFAEHFNYVGELVRRSGYRFPKEREKAEQLSRKVDDLLARNHPEVIMCWRNLLNMASEMRLKVSKESIYDFLAEGLPNASEIFRASLL
ncbi:MAG: hypothetical protein NZ805_09075 [Armatimonadetes bacterium]|nr:hypothetical protein [Armatimonadota bacterium]MDW8029285.1 hypothetical protein [Armatimonadota bacterium]